MEKDITPLGLVWLCNTLQRHSHSYCIEELFINEKMISSALEDLQNIGASREHANVAFFMEKIFTMPCEKNGYWYFIKHEQLLLKWISNANSETAYAYSRLINTVYNVDKKYHHQFACKIDWAQMMHCMAHEDHPDLYVWGKLWNRATYSLHRREFASMAEELQQVVEEISHKITASAILDFSDFLCSISHLVPMRVHKMVRTMLPLYQEYFEGDMARAIYLFDFDFFLHICGINLLSEHRASREQRKTAAALVAILPAVKFASVISNSLPRDWQRIHEIMGLIAQYDPVKAREIATSVDIVRLSVMAKDCWNQPEDLWHVCRILQIGDNEIACRFIDNNQSEIRNIYLFLAIISPQFAIKKFKDGICINRTPGAMCTEFLSHLAGGEGQR